MGNALHPVLGPWERAPRQRTDQRLRWVSAVIVSATAFLLVSVLLVGTTGFEPVTSSVSANQREPLCQAPFPQVTPDRSGRSYHGGNQMG